MQRINNKRQNLNTKIKAFNQAVLKAAHESIPRGARKNYKPYWTEELQQQEDAVREARNLVWENPSEENNISLKAASAKHQRTLIQEEHKPWHEKTEQLNLDRDGKKLWNLVAALNEEKSKSSQIVLETEGKLCAGKQAANILIKQYAETSDLQIPTDRKRETRKEQHASPVHKEEPTMNSPFVTKELEDALTMLKLRKAPGSDNITNEMLLSHWYDSTPKQIPAQVGSSALEADALPLGQQGGWQESKSLDKATLEQKENPQARHPTRWSAVPNSVPHLHPWHPASNAQEHTRSHQRRRPCVMVQRRIHHHCKL